MEETQHLKQHNDYFGISREEYQIIQIIAERGRIDDYSKGFNDFFYYHRMSLEDLASILKETNIKAVRPTIVCAMRDCVAKNKNIYQESIEHYYSVLDNYKKLAQELNLKSALELSHMMTYLLWNGYLSVNKEHCYKIKGRLLLPGLNYFDVIKGRGVCLAYSELLNSYLSVCGKESTVLICNMPLQKDAITRDYTPEIERKIEKNLKTIILNKMLFALLGRVIAKFGNHAIIMIKENENMYAYDPTNLLALNIESSARANVINGTGEVQLRPLSSLLMNPFIDPNLLFDDLLFGSVTSSLAREEFVNTFEEVLALMKNNTKLLDDAYDNIHHDLAFINQQTNEIGGSLKVLKRKEPTEK